MTNKKTRHCPQPSQHFPRLSHIDYIKFFCEKGRYNPWLAPSPKTTKKPTSLQKSNSLLCKTFLSNYTKQKSQLTSILAAWSKSDYNADFILSNHEELKTIRDTMSKIYRHMHEVFDQTPVDDESNRTRITAFFSDIRALHKAPSIISLFEMLENPTISFKQSVLGVAKEEEEEVVNLPRALEGLKI